MLLFTPRLQLERVTSADLQKAYSTRNRDELIVWMGDEEVYKKNLQRFQSGVFEGQITAVQFHIALKEASSTIGACGFHQWLQEHRRAEIGYAFFNDAHKNKGYMTEALAVVLAYGFREMDLHRVDSLVEENNIPSVRLMEHFGFKQEGFVREHYLRNGVFESSVMYGLLKQEFSAL